MPTIVLYRYVIYHIASRLFSKQNNNFSKALSLWKQIPQNLATTIKRHNQNMYLYWHVCAYTQLNSNLTLVLDYSWMFIGLIWVTHQCSYATYLCATLVVLWIWLTSDRIWNLLKHFMSIHMNLLMSSSEWMQTQESIPGTCNSLINSFLVHGYKHK